jgi:ubiquinone biosynthesis protein
MSFQSEVSRRAVIRRSKEIAAVFLKYEIPIETLFPGIHIRLNKPKIGSEVPLNKRLRLALQELGPTFIKFGQVMSTRPDLIPPELATELKLLTDNVKTVDWALIEPVIEEYCNPIDETFISLDKQPLAAASLSQAYLGKLKDGTNVVLKVQRPGIKDTIELDLHILKAVAIRAKSAPELQLFNVPEAIEDFSHQILSEIDFTRDGRNANLLARNLQSINGIHIPKIYWQCSGQRLLVMEYVKGVRIDKIEQIKQMGVDPKQIASIGFQAYWKQVFDDGFFHGDPHPGNLLVMDNGELVFLDYGLFGVVRPEKRDNLLKLVLGLVERNIDLIVGALESFGLVVEDSQVDAFKDDIYRILVENESKSIEPDIRLLDDLVELLKRYRLVVPTSLMLMIKVFGMVQDVCSKLNPEFILLQEAKPLLAKSFKGRVVKEVNMQQVGLSLFEKFDSLKEFPKNMNMTLKQLSKGSFILKIPADDLLRLERIGDRASYRILLGLVIASIVVGMSLVVLATQSVLTAVPVQVTLFVYGFAILIVLLSAIQLMRSRNKHWLVHKS